MKQSGAAGGTALGTLAHGAAGSPVPTGGAVRELLARAERLLESARAVPAGPRRDAVDAVRSVLDPVLDSLVGRELAAIPVSRLKDVTEGRLRLGALEQAGFGTVGQVHGTHRYELRQLPGVGAHTADQALAAAAQIAHAVRDTVSVRIDVDAPDDTSTALVVALHRLAEAGADARRAVDAARRLAERLGPPAAAAGPAELVADAVHRAGRHARGCARPSSRCVRPWRTPWSGSCRCSSRRRRPTCCGHRRRPPRPGWTSSSGPPSTTAC